MSLTGLDKKEKNKCRQDPVYFIKKYGKLFDPTRGKINFNCSKLQEKTINDFQAAKNSNSFAGKKNIFIKSRQLGFSTISAYYALWLALFYKNKSILILTINNNNAIHFMKKIRTALIDLPRPFFDSVEKETNQKIFFSTGSFINVSEYKDDICHSQSFDLLIVDEASYVKDLNKNWIVLASSMKKDGEIIISVSDENNNIFRSLNPSFSLFLLERIGEFGLIMFK